MTQTTGTPEIPDKVAVPGGRVSSYVYPTLTAVALFLIWEAVARLGAISPLLLPAPSEVLMTTVKDFPLLYQMSVVTAAEFLLGFGLSVLVGLPVGALIVYARPVELSLYPLAGGVPDHAEGRDCADLRGLARDRDHAPRC